MSKKVLIAIGIAVVALAAAFFFYKQELTKDPEEYPEDPDEDLHEDPTPRQKKGTEDQPVTKIPEEIPQPENETTE
jgi:hypothetical protein